MFQHDEGAGRAFGAFEGHGWSFWKIEANSVTQAGDPKVWHSLTRGQAYQKKAPLVRGFCFESPICALDGQRRHAIAASARYSFLKANDA